MNARRRRGPPSRGPGFTVTGSSWTTNTADIPTFDLALLRWTCYEPPASLNPDTQEWDEFLGHFERRKVALGTCGRSCATQCIHELACLRCPLLRPDPAQPDRLLEVRDNLIARIAEARTNNWLGVVDGLQVSLSGAREKLTQLDQRASTASTQLGLPPLNPSR